MKQKVTPIFSLIALTFALACTIPSKSQNKMISDDEVRLCDSLRIDTSIVRTIRKLNSGKIEPFHYSLSTMYKDGHEIELDPIHLDGLVFSEENQKSYDLVFTLKDKLRSKGYSIFLLENNFGLGNKMDRIGVLKTTDKFTVLRQVKTDGINYDIDNDSLISIMRLFDKKYSLELIGASGDWCEFIITKEPADWMEFANEVYRVCRDVVDQGTETIEALAAEMKRTKRLYFWWD